MIWKVYKCILPYSVGDCKGFFKFFGNCRSANENGRSGPSVGRRHDGLSQKENVGDVWIRRFCRKEKTLLTNPFASAILSTTKAEKWNKRFGYLFQRAVGRCEAAESGTRTHHGAFFPNGYVLVCSVGENGFLTVIRRTDCLIGDVDGSGSAFDWKRQGVFVCFADRNGKEHTVYENCILYARLPRL